MKRMYRTGDLVYEEGGKIWFIGRKDNQIKHMGYRIELEEIENILVQSSKVDQAAVLYERSNITHGKIIAFVATKSDLTIEQIFQHASNFLPNYMIPSSINLFKELPKNPNGKVDKLKLASLHNLK